MKPVETKYSKNNPGHYVPGMIHNNTLYISGQLSVNNETGQVGETFEEEVIQALNNMEYVLKEAGLDKSHVVMCRVYISSIDLWPELNEIYGRWFGEHKPARAVVPVPVLHYGCKVEIEAVAEYNK